MYTGKLSQIAIYLQTQEIVLLDNTVLYYTVIAERRERSEANNRVLFKIPRYLYIYIYIYIYMSVCTCIAQDRTHLTQVLSRRPLCIWNTGCCSENHFEESPFRPFGMADGASLAEDSPDDDSDFSRTSTTTGHRMRLDDDSDLGRTRTATGQKKRSLSQTAAQREERLVVERLKHDLFLISSSYYTCTLPCTSFSLLYVFTLLPYPFFVITHLSNS